LPPGRRNRSQEPPVPSEGFTDSGAFR
jgi:hypothetical protein